MWDCTDSYTAVRGVIEGNGLSNETVARLINLLKLQQLGERNGNEGNLTETPYFTTTERTGFEPAEPIQAHGFSKPAH